VPGSLFVGSWFSNARIQFIITHEVFTQPLEWATYEPTSLALAKNTGK